MARNTSVDERRKYFRLRDGVTVALTTDNEFGEERSDLGWRASFCSTRDLSLGGLQIDLHDSLPRGSRVKLDIALADPDQIFARTGKVAWVRNVDKGFSYRTGIAFADAIGGRTDAWRDALLARYGESAIAV